MAVLLIWSLIGLLVVRTVLTIVMLDSLIDAYAEDFFGASTDSCAVAESEFRRELVEVGAPPTSRSP